MYATFNRFEIKLTKAQAAMAAHQGQCDQDVFELSQIPAVRRQLAKLEPAAVRAELSEYGAWDAEELADHAENLQRILWLAAGDIMEPRA